MGLAEAVNIADDRRRTNAIAKAMDTMLNEDDPIRTEEEWAFLHHTLLRRHEALPANTNDVATVLVTKRSYSFDAVQDGPCATLRSVGA